MSLKDLFPSYYHPTSAELRALWDRADFVLDANVLLNIYRLTANSRDELLTALESIRDRLWTPYQVATEYQRNRQSVLAAQLSSCDALLNHLDAATKLLTSICDISSLDTNPQPEHGNPLEEINKQLLQITGRATQVKKAVEKMLVDDPLRDRLDTILRGHIASPYDEQHLAKVYADADTRIERHIPPGYCDDKKDSPGKYGDVVIWTDLLDHAKETQRPIIFVTDDKKEDWFASTGGRTLGPRRELIEEMLEKANQPFWSYTTEQFLKYARDNTASHISEATITEAGAPRFTEPTLPTTTPLSQDIERRIARSYATEVGHRRLVENTVRRIHQSRQLLRSKHDTLVDSLCMLHLTVGYAGTNNRPMALDLPSLPTKEFLLLPRTDQRHYFDALQGALLPLDRQLLDPSHRTALAEAQAALFAASSVFRDVCEQEQLLEHLLQPRNDTPH